MNNRPPAKGSALPIRLPRWYPPPDRKPVPWWQHQSAKVQTAVRSYLWLEVDHNGEPRPITRTEGRWLVAYLQYAIEAPCWAAPPDVLARLRRAAYYLGDSSQVGYWLQECMQAGIDILGGLP